MKEKRKEVITLDIKLIIERCKEESKKKLEENLVLTTNRLRCHSEHACLPYSKKSDCLPKNYS